MERCVFGLVRWRLEQALIQQGDRVKGHFRNNRILALVVTEFSNLMQTGN